MSNRLVFVISRICLCASLLLVLPVHAKRLALVIGNDNYTSVSKLQKAGNDASAMARELKAAGFAVQLHKDLNYRGMVKAVEGFANSITGGDEVVVFYAGHGVQIKTGSYLLPTDIEASSESEVEKTAYELNALTDKISEAKPAFSLVMVDACRDNPLKAKGRSVGNTRGLSAVEPPKGQIVVYSASRGQQALDRLSDKDANPNGVFTREFIARMKKPGVRIDDLIREVQDSVEALAKSVNHEQRPAIYNEARGNFYFFEPTKVESASLSSLKSEPSALELAMWDGVKNATTVAEIQAYLNRFPNGFFSELARARIEAFGGVRVERLSGVVQVGISEPQPNAVATNYATLPAANQYSSTQHLDSQTSIFRNPASVIKDCEDCPEMVVIPAGSFEMGSVEDKNSMPVHTVNIKSFLLGKTEITRGQWKAVMGEYASTRIDCAMVSDQCPAQNASFNEAVEFARRLSLKTGKRYRLPSEAEWEFAARAGSKTSWSFGDSIIEVNEFAWSKRNSCPTLFGCVAQLVATKKPNAFGLYDMHGNMSEMTEDCVTLDYINAPTNGAAVNAPVTGKELCTMYIFRGGSYVDSENILKTAKRGGRSKGSYYFNIGVRIARDL